ncbi:MAG: IPT/TIG domain-containing protein [Planctomycetes bacterium]|nr:IPT/TIG domain-containing protein [Planctomycetota bacterium]
MRRIFSIAAVHCFFAVLASAQTVLVPQGEDWRFFRGREAPPPNWATPEFEAAGWETGPTGIGYGDNDDATVLGDMQNNYLAVYLRTEFVIPENMKGFTWTLRVRFDDGFVAYLDGDEFARRNVDGAPPAFDDPASADHEITSAAGFDEAIPVLGAEELLVPGRHVLAAEVHNINLTSTDLSFSAELSTYPFVVTALEPAFGPLEGGNTVAIRGGGFNPEEAPAVRFGGKASPQVGVISAAELQAAVPAGDLPGLVAVEVEDSRGRVVLPNAYRYSGGGETALAFDGLLDVATAERYGELAGQGTFEAWFLRGSDFLNLWRIVLAVEAPDGTNAFRIEARNNEVRARTWVEGTPSNLAATGLSLGAGQWHHLAFTFSPQGRKLYFDGALAASDALAMRLEPGTRFRLGNGFSGGLPVPFLGQLQSIRVWGAERTALEIRRYAFAGLRAGEGLESSWPLSEGIGQEARDLGPGKHTLVLGATDAVEEADPQWAAVENFPALAITDIDPDHGPSGGGNAVRLFGTGFSAARPPAVRFGAAEAAAVKVLERWELEAVAPAGPANQAVDVTVQAAQGSFTAPRGYTYEPPLLYDLVREGDFWQYAAGTAPPPANWTLPEFNPINEDWKTGRSGLGYGDGDDATDVSIDVLNRSLTLYARTEWEMAGGGERINFLRLRIRYDDGFVAWLNGQEVARANVTGRPPRFDEPADGQHEIEGSTGTFDDEIDILEFRHQLRRGKNVLAVEVHNASLDSTDMSLSAELIYSAPGAAFTRGDVDGNLDLTVSDAVSILRGLFAGGQLACAEAADVDDDGVLSIVDAFQLLGYLFTAGAEPPLPFRQAAPDLDDDLNGCE